MALSVQDVSTVFLMTRPEASSRVDSCLSWTSPRMAKSAACALAAGGASPSATDLRLVGTWQGWAAYAIPGPDNIHVQRRSGIALTTDSVPS